MGNSLMHSSCVRLIAAIMFVALFRSDARSEDVRIVSWNVRECFTPRHVTRRSRDFRNAATELRPDILLLQEICSLAVAEQIASEMGLDNYYIACSDFMQNETLEHRSFEVAIVSKYPFAQIMEYDPSPEGETEEGYPEESGLPDTVKLGVPRAGTERGILWARLRTIPLTLSVVHLKSALGGAGYGDRENAEKREYVTAAAAIGVNEDRRYYPDHTCIVAGDFNVGHLDEEKNGIDLQSDWEGDDGYDETHALLEEGLVGGLKMINITRDISEDTYIERTFNSGPIDNIYVVGPHQNRFSAGAGKRAAASADSFGSDHLAVYTVLDLPGELQNATQFVRIGSATTESGAVPPTPAPEGAKPDQTRPESARSDEAEAEPAPRPATAEAAGAPATIEEKILLELNAIKQRLDALEAELRQQSDN